MSLEEDTELLRAVREWRPPEKLHPIAMFTWDIYEANEFSMPPEGVAKVKAVLDGYGDDLVALAEAMEGLIRFILCVRHMKQDEISGQKISDLCRAYAHLYEPFWTRVGEAMANVGDDTRAVFQKMMGAEPTDKAAPAVGQAPPPGTIPLSRLVDPGRPPPFRPAKPSKASEKSSEKQKSSKKTSAGK
ncbi:MAG: hypothetical protein HY791_22955 [Deltaproteobacteria bacterium]|nr:hypothetical protein [Deltaproteobacteria bacterium]